MNFITLIKIFSVPPSNEYLIDVKSLFPTRSEYKMMVIKMECKHKEGTAKCQKFATHACNDCTTFEFYCKTHGGEHHVDTNHHIVLIEKVELKFFKHHIKSCISDIAKNTNSVIIQLNQSSLNAITHLKQISKNIKTINELDLHFYDSRRIAFLVEQASYISMKMNEIDTQIGKQAFSNSNSLTLKSPPQPNPSTLQATHQRNPSLGQGTN